MKNCGSTLIATFVVLPILLPLAGCGVRRHQPPQRPAPDLIRIISSNEGFLITEGENKVLFYQRKAKSLDGKYSRANYVHPLYGLDGEILTEDFPDDHLHHRGIFWAWHQIWIGQKRIGDGWSLKDISWDVYDARISDVDSNSSVLELGVYWKSPMWTDAEGNQEPFIKETTTIRIHRTEGDLRKIDFVIKLLALEDSVRVGGAENAREYGGFSTRIRLPEGMVFTGPEGPVEPKGTPVGAVAWMDFSGPFGNDDSISGLAVLCHKANPLYPHRWILRRKGSMQNPVYPGRHFVLLFCDKPLVLCYRLIIHRGDADHINLDELQAEYDAEHP